jgi:hypothetical protein
MIAGDVCPTDPNQYIDVLNCAQIGIRDGFQNWLFLGYWTFGNTFVDIVSQISAALFTTFLPGVHGYVTNTLNAFVNANPTAADRQAFCFYATIPGMITPLLIFIIVIAVGVALVLALVALLEGLIKAYMATPASVVVTGTQNSVWFDPPNPQDTEQEQEDINVDGEEEDDGKGKPLPAAAPIKARQGSFFTNWMHGGPPPPPLTKSQKREWEKKNQ